jgi:hypothetical protein
MNSPHLSLCILLFCGTALIRAQDVRAGKSNMTRYELKTRSSFNLPESTRPPFWPIGWAKRGATAAPVRMQTGPRYVLDEKNFSVTSILTGNPSLAVINGRSYAEGDVLRMPKGSGVRIRVARIYDGIVQLRLDDQVVSPKLRREEIEPKKATEELLLDEER